MVALEAATSSSIFFSHHPTRSSSSSSSSPSPSSFKFPPAFKALPSCLLDSSSVSSACCSVSLKFPPPFSIRPSNNHSARPRFKSFSAVQEVAEAEQAGETQPHQKRKLYVANLPFSVSNGELKDIFAQCGTVKEIEIIKGKDGKNRGYAFVTMASEDDSQAVIDKFGSFELSGRTIKVEFAKQFNKPASPSLAQPPAKEEGHKLYVSNLAWKVRSNHLREFFSANFSPISARVVFSTPEGRASGYGFISFATREEAVAAISTLDGKELMGRPVRLKFSEKKAVDSTDIKEEEVISEGKPEMSEIITSQV